MSCWPRCPRSLCGKLRTSEHRDEPSLCRAAVNALWCGYMAAACMRQLCPKRVICVLHDSDVPLKQDRVQTLSMPAIGPLFCKMLAISQVATSLLMPTSTAQGCARPIAAYEHTPGRMCTYCSLTPRLTAPSSLALSVFSTYRTLLYMMHQHCAARRLMPLFSPAHIQGLHSQLPRSWAPSPCTLPAAEVVTPYCGALSSTPELCPPVSARPLPSARTDLGSLLYSAGGPSGFELLLSWMPGCSDTLLSVPAVARGLPLLRSACFACLSRLSVGSSGSMAAVRAGLSARSPGAWLC